LRGQLMARFGLMRRLRPVLADDAFNFDPAPLAHQRIVEAVLFAATEPLDEDKLKDVLPPKADLRAILEALADHYSGRGIRLVRIGEAWAFRTAEDLGPLLRREVTEPKKLSRAAQETLAIIAYHQPVTRADIEAIRGVSVAKGTLETLLETGWIRLRGRRKTPGRPVTLGTTPAFLDHFGLETLNDLPGVDELKAAGLMDGRVPAGFDVPMPSDDGALRNDEEPIEDSPVDVFSPLDAAE
jgi:segregation and condensation protein B